MKIIINKNKSKKLNILINLLKHYVADKNKMLL